jgi:hypothetical protein
MSLIPCPTCRRHVRVGDATCPFCASALPHDHASRAVPSASTRLGRSALFAFAVSVSACGASTESEPVVTDTGTTKGDTGTTNGDTGNAADTLVNDTGGPVAAYGAPADTGPVDTGSPDTGTTDDGGPAPLYGLPPPDGGA